MDDNPYRAPLTTVSPLATSRESRQPFSAVRIVLFLIGALIGAGAGLAVGCVLVAIVGSFIWGGPNDLEGGRQARIEILGAVQTCVVLICPATGVVAGAMIARSLSLGRRGERLKRG